MSVPVANPYESSSPDDKKRYGILRECCTFFFFFFGSLNLRTQQNILSTYIISRVSMSCQLAASAIIEL